MSGPTVRLITLLVVLVASKAQESGGWQVSSSLSSFQFDLTTTQHQPLRAGRKLQQASLCSSGCASVRKSLVCGRDKKTYDNTCYAFCAKTTVAHFGKCSAKPCLCPPLFAPVCASGKSYFNPCFAGCAGVKMAKAGLCPGDCQCPSTKAVVTGMDGKVYDNVCKAACAGTGTAYSGTPDARLGSCTCGAEYSPVCETKTEELTFPGGAPVRRVVNVTHLNPCIAACQGAKETKPGVCSDYVQYKPEAWSCGCPLVFDPVCVSTGKLGLKATAINKCAADCQGLKIVSPGICPGCSCPLTAKPVCAGNKTYKTACAARCEGGATTWTEGPCTPCSKCPKPTGLDSFVCTSSGTSYPTACNAECLGETVLSKGVCAQISGRTTTAQA